MCYPKRIVESPTNCEGGVSPGGKAKPETTPNSSEAVLVSQQSQDEKPNTKMDSTALSPNFTACKGTWTYWECNKVAMMIVIKH